MTNRQANFDVSPRIIKILGEELIHDKKIAIAELVKNAYDADATLVKITVGVDEIIIEDDGCGMNADTIENYWLKPGSSGKRDNKERTPKFKRLPLGEKGVGRLGVHRLGHKISVISKAKDDREVLFELDWDALEKIDNLSDIPPILIEERVYPSQFTGTQTGTKLIIEELKEGFEDKDISLLHNDLLKLLSPFEHATKKQFHIELHTQFGLFTEEKKIELKDLLEQALFSYDISFKDEDITKFTYKCVSPNQNKYPAQTIDLNDENIKQTIKEITDKYIKKLTEETDYLNNSTAKIKLGEVRFRGYIFEPRLSKLFQRPLKRATTAYLKENGGIRVYRDGVRVYNYGEDGKDNDILNLDRKRAKKLGDNIGYNQILAAIELDHESSTSLVEKTNREGFIHNDAFLYLQQKLDLCMEVVTYFRKLDKAEINLLDGKVYDKGDIDTRINEIIKQVAKLSVSDAEKIKINSNLEIFSNEFKQIKNIFLTASNTGLNMTFIIHEVDKIIDHLEVEIKNRDLAKVETVFNYLKRSIQSYKDTIRLDKKASLISLSSIVEQAIFNAEYRFESHHIKLHKALDANISIACKKGLIIGSVHNIFDNAIYWLGTHKISPKEIFIKSYSDDLHHNLVIADNGKGFNISFEAALRPFISGRVDESSMGIGLHLVYQVMQAHGGIISHGNKEADQIPQQFANGAIIKLSFPKQVE